MIDLFVYLVDSYQFVCLSKFMCVRLSVYVCLCICLAARLCLSVCLYMFVCVPVCLSIYLCLSVCPLVCLIISLSIALSFSKSALHDVFYNA